jgi:hypothetical protein
MPARSVKGALMGGLLVISSLAMIHSAAAAPPPDWRLFSMAPGEGPRYYIARMDHATAYDGSGSALLESKTDALSRSGTLAQGVVGNAFAGRKIQFSAYIKTRNVRKLAGLWIRAEDVTGRVIAFKNVSSPGSRLRGTTDWTQVHIAINIPSAAVAIFYGIQLLGTGAVWIDNVRFDVLGKADPDAPGPTFTVYNPPPVPSLLLPRPENLNFEK